MSNFDGCQLPGIPKFSRDSAGLPERSGMALLKRLFANPWNRYVKKWLKRAYYSFVRGREPRPHQLAAQAFVATVPYKKGEWVRVRSREEIDSTLDPFKELKGCAFVPDMYNYCGSRQRVLRSMQHFMDERDYRYKKVRGLILLENVMCRGAAAFGECDRCCFLFWREEWLERIEPEEGSLPMGGMSS